MNKIKYRVMPETELFPKSCKILRKKNTKSICLSLFIEWNKKLNIKVPLNMFLTTFMTVSNVNVYCARCTFCLGVDTSYWTSNIGLEYFFSQEHLCQYFGAFYHTFSVMHRIIYMHGRRGTDYQSNDQHIRFLMLSRIRFSYDLL